jgi:hypothetical protein
MKIAIKQANGVGAVVWETVAGDGQTVAACIRRGQEIGPTRVSVGQTERFFSADWLFVDIRRSTGLLSQLLAHDFTAENAGVIWLAADSGNGNTRCLIGFPLAVPIVDAGQYRVASAGLAAIYGEVTSVEALHSWQVAGNGTTKMMAGSLSGEMLRRLELVGGEASRHAGKKTKAFVRSAVRLDSNQVLTMADGTLADLKALEAGARVRCPIHIDPLGVAHVLGSGGAKGVQCPVCQRNYWVTSPFQAIDFGHFRRVFGDLHTQEACGTIDSDVHQFVLLRERYLPPLKFRKGVTLIRSPMGTGKTESAVSLVQECKAGGFSVLVIGHRRSLLRTLAQRLGLDLYFETIAEDDSAADFQAVDVTDGYAICLDSVPTRLQPAVHKFDVVIIDEAEQVIRHLAGGTLKDKRRLAYETFGHYVKVASAVYLMDAHLDALTLSFVTRTVDPSADVRFIVNEPPVEQRHFDLMPTRESVVGKLAAAVAEGKKCYMATNSKRRAIATALWLQAHWPDKRVVAITQENAQQPKVQDLLGNLAEEFEFGRDGEKALDVLIGSPAIGTGIDITFDGGAVGVDHVFGIFEAGVTTHFDVDQQLARVRNPGNVSVWVCPETLNFETAPEAVLRELRNTVARTDGFVGFDRSGGPIFTEHDRPFIELWSEIAATERTSKNALIDNWTALRERDGWVAIIGQASDEDKDRGKAAMVEGKLLREAERAKRIMDADDIDDMEGARLNELSKKGAPLSTQDLARLEKWQLKEFYVTTVDEALIAFDDDARTRRAVDMLEVMVGDVTLNQKIDKGQIDLKGDARVIAFDRQFRTAKADVLGRLLVAAGLLDAETGKFKVDAELRTDSLDDFVAAYIADKRRIQSELGLDMRSDITTKPVQQLGRVLSLVGANVVLAATTKDNGVKRRTYRIDGEKVMALMDIVVRRTDRRRERWEAKSTKAQKVIRGDNAPPDDLKTVQHELSPDGDETSGDAHQLDQGHGDALAAAVRSRRLVPCLQTAPKAKKLTIASIPMSL